MKRRLNMARREYRLGLALRHLTVRRRCLADALARALEHQAGTSDVAKVTTLDLWDVIAAATLKSAVEDALSDLAFIESYIRETFGLVTEKAVAP